MVAGRREVACGAALVRRIMRRWQLWCGVNFGIALRVGLGLLAGLVGRGLLFMPD